eukprot:scpid104001/ scgid12151/ 
MHLVQAGGRLRLYMWERLILEIIHKRAFPSKILPKRLSFATIGGVLIAITIDDSRYARVASMATGLLQSCPPLFIVCTTCLQSSSKTLTVALQSINFTSLGWFASYQCSTMILLTA